MITELEKAVHQSLVAASQPGGALEGVPAILDNAMTLAPDGGLAVEGREEIYSGGAENRRAFATGEVAIHAVIYVNSRSRKFRAARDEADALARKVRRALRADLYLGGFSVQPLRILRTETGYSVHDGNRVSVATVVVEMDYDEDLS